MKKERAKKGSVLNTTAMLDVIFIMLIFFVAVSKIRDGSLDLQLPEARGDSSDRSERSENDLIVSIDNQDRILLGDLELENVEELGEILQLEGAAAGTDRPVVFLADRESHSGPLVGALKAATDAGFKNVSFIYQPKPESRR